MKIIKPILFCLLCAIVLATVSGLIKNFLSEWSQHLLLIITIVITYGLTILFARWEKLPLKKVGVVANKRTPKKVAVGFGLGLLMTLLQPVIVLLLGHYNMSFNPAISAYPIFFYFTLYFLVAIREELAFRGYPLFSLNYSFGLWASQFIILVIFSLEHIVGGMTWVQAFLGAGTGALLFGFAALKAKGIALPFGLHAAWNFGQWCFGFKKESGIFHGIADKGYENVVERNSWISYLLIMAIAIAIIYFYRPKTKVAIPA
ncbi:CPBP family intramembrane metalloprotease [Ilyomonas limi]|uniref:CPBP family intramembrane metalloprotease n=1 Tax=Ilyomonas limi TaxID=2575867 RepID=A0A4V5UVI5_9BACT|nr:type II CAAX endopeptidase family protein [Ilyomonas limi]TKK67703.1 CPBP family intramembrane metalloprotease [Ilyomonas limi]